MSIVKVAFAGASLLTLAACAYNEPAALVTPQFGEAVSRNIAAQTVNPDAPADKGPLTFDASRAAIGQERYITDMVENPGTVGTQSTQGQGQGQGGASAGGTAGAK